MWPLWDGFTMKSHVGVVTEVMVRGLTVDVASISLAIILGVTVRGHCKEFHQYRAQFGNQDECGLQ